MLVRCPFFITHAKGLVLKENSHKKNHARTVAGHGEAGPVGAASPRPAIIRDGQLDYISGRLERGKGPGCRGFGERLSSEIALQLRSHRSQWQLRCSWNHKRQRPSAPVERAPQRLLDAQFVASAKRAPSSKAELVTRRGLCRVAVPYHRPLCARRRKRFQTLKAGLVEKTFLRTLGPSGNGKTRLVTGSRVDVRFKVVSTNHWRIVGGNTDRRESGADEKIADNCYVGGPAFAVGNFPEVEAVTVAGKQVVEDADAVRIVSVNSDAPWPPAGWRGRSGRD